MGYLGTYDGVHELCRNGVFAFMRLGELAEVQMGYPFRSRLEHDPQGGVAVIQMKDIDDANLLHAEESIRVMLPKGKAHHLLRAGDLLFRSRGRSNGAAQVREGIGPAVLAAPMLLIRPHKETPGRPKFPCLPRGAGGAQPGPGGDHKVLPAYLCWYINAPATQTQLAALAEGTSVRMISAEALKALEVPLPSLAIQQRIVQAAGMVEQEQALLARIATLRQRLTTPMLMKLAQPSPETATP